MSVRASDLRRGMGVQYNGQVWVVFSAEHVAKGNKRSYMQVELKNPTSEQIIKERFRVDDSLDEAFFEKKMMEYLYTDSAGHVVMDTENFEQMHLPEDLVGDKSVFLKPNILLEVAFVEGQPVSVELPNTVELEVVDTLPQIKGATATNQLKDAECRGGAKVKVPPFVENGTVIKVDTRSGEYISRA